MSASGSVSESAMAGLTICIGVATLGLPSSWLGGGGDTNTADPPSLLASASADGCSGAAASSRVDPGLVGVAQGAANTVRSLPSSIAGAWDSVASSWWLASGLASERGAGETARDGTTTSQSSAMVTGLRHEPRRPA